MYLMLLWVQAGKRIPRISWWEVWARKTNGESWCSSLLHYKKKCLSGGTFQAALYVLMWFIIKISHTNSYTNSFSIFSYTMSVHHLPLFWLCRYSGNLLGWHNSDAFLFLTTTWPGLLSDIILSPLKKIVHPKMAIYSLLWMTCFLLWNQKTKCNKYNCVMVILFHAVTVNRKKDH